MTGQRWQDQVEFYIDRARLCVNLAKNYLVYFGNENYSEIIAATDYLRFAERILEEVENERNKV